MRALLALLTAIALSVVGSAAPALAASVTLTATIVSSPGVPVSGSWLLIDGSVVAGVGGVVTASVDPGSHRVSAYATGFQGRDLGVIDVPSGGMNLGEIIVAPVAVAAGVVRIGDRIAGAGEVAVYVEACEVAGGACNSDGAPRTTTDSQGRYQVTLWDGHYRLRFAPPLSAPRAFQPAVVFITVTAATRTQTVDVVAKPVRTLTGTVRLGAEGRLATAGEVAVALWYPNSNGYERVLTDANGRYTFVGLSDRIGNYLQFDYIGSGPYVDLWWGGALDLPSSPSITISGDASYDMTLPSGGAISGRVTTPDSRGPGGITVTARGWIDSSEVVQRTTVASDGTWAIDGLPDGIFHVKATDERIMSTAGSGIWGETNQSQEGAPIEVAVGRSVSGIDILMREFSIIDGHITCRNCAHLGNMWGQGYVSLELKTPSGWVPGGVGESSGLVDLPGSPPSTPYYQLRRVLAGTYRATLHALPGLPGGGMFRPVVSREFTIVEGQGQVVDFEFTPGVGERDFNGDAANDVLAVFPSGALAMYNGNGQGGWSGSAVIGSGWGGFASVFSPGDFSGDGTMDVIARDRAGGLWLYAGNGLGGWLGGRQIGSGWQSFTSVFSPGDFDGDGKADVIARFPNGNLYLYRGNGVGGWIGAQPIGSGWQSFDSLIGPGDFDGDGAVDVLARLPNGNLYLYRGSGAGGWKGSALVGSGWSMFSSLAAAGNFDGAGGVDLMARDAAGYLYLYRGSGTGGWLGGTRIGSGWNGLNLVA